MLEALSAKIAAVLCKSSVIDESDTELYTYGFFVLLSKVLFFIVATAFGVIFKIASESMLFYILFCLIRSYAGGIHAPKEWICNLFTSLSMLLSVGCIKMMILYHVKMIAIAALCLSVFVIVAFSPLDTKEKPLNETEKKRYGRITYLILFGIVALAFLWMVLHKDSMFYSCVMSLFLESILLFAGKLNSIL